MTRPTLDGHALMQTAFTGFNYPQNAQVVALLGDGTTPGGNAVLQQSALTFRQATLSWVAASPAEVAAIRVLSESKAAVAYVDHDGNPTVVRVLELSPAVMVGDYWSCTATLVEIGGVVSGGGPDDEVPPPDDEVFESLSASDSAAVLLDAAAEMTIDAIELADGDYDLQNIIFGIDRTLRPLIIRPAIGADVAFVGPATASGIIWQFGDASHAPKWVTLTGHASDGSGSMTFRDFDLAQSGAIEVRGSDHLTFRHLGFSNLGRDAGHAPYARLSWGFYISGAGMGVNDHLLIDHPRFDAPASPKEISAIQVASSGSHGAIAITNVDAMDDYDFGIYVERPVTALTIDQVVMSNTGDSGPPASIDINGPGWIAGSVTNVTGTGGCEPYRDVHSGGGVVTTFGVSIS